MRINHMYVKGLVSTTIMVILLPLLLLLALPTYHLFEGMSLVKDLEKNQNLLNTTFRKHVLPLQEPPTFFQPLLILTTFKLRTLNLSKEGPFNLISTKPIPTTFKTRLIGLSRLFSVSISVEPKGYVWNREIIGAGRWYVFRVKVFNLFGHVDLVSIDIVSGDSRLANVKCSGSSCSSPSHLVNSISVISSSFEYIVDVNVSIPWNVSGELLVNTSVSISDSLLGVTISKELRLLVVNETSVDVNNIRIWPRDITPGSNVRVVARIIYSGTSIPVVGEKVRVYFTPSSGVPALAIMSSNGYVEAITNSSGYIDVVLQAPTQPGNYNLVVEPLHGNPVSISQIVVTGAEQPTTTGMQTVTVGEGVLGGIARFFVNSTFILGMTTGITMLALLIILQRKRKHRGKT